METEKQKPTPVKRTLKNTHPAGFLLVSAMLMSGVGLRKKPTFQDPEEAKAKLEAARLKRERKALKKGKL